MENFANDYEENYITGYVSLFRSFINWEWFKEPNMVTVFVYCLLKANYSDARWKGIEIKQGSFITSYNSISVDTGLSVQKVRTCIKKLCETKELTSQTTSKYTLLTVVKYSVYQQKNVTPNKVTNNQLTNNQQTTNKQLTTDNNNNKNNNSIYTENEFLEDWTQCRKTFLKVPTNFKSIKTYDLPKFNKAVKDYSKDQIREAMRGLFMQEVISFSSMTLHPSHFLENVDKYYNAFISKDKKLYGSKPVQQ